MPPEAARVRRDSWMQPGGLVPLIAVATPHGGGWGVFVPAWPGLDVVVQDIDEADDALANKAAALTGRASSDFIVSVQYVGPPNGEQTS